MNNKPAIVTENMHKFVYLANEYKGSKTAQLFKMFEFPLLDFQAASYLAEDLGYVKIIKKSKGDYRFEVLSMPEDLNLGDDVRYLINTLQFVFTRLEKDETDLAEWELNSWMEGYPTHDQFIAVKWLLNNGILGSYDITVSYPKEMKLPNDTRTYYCIAGNESKRWGEKQIPDTNRIVR